MVKGQSLFARWTSRVLQWFRVGNGGQDEAAPYPDCVMVFKRGWFHCSGVVIAPRVVATAAHCVKGLMGSKLNIKVGPSQGDIMGSFDVRDPVPHGDYEELEDESHWHDIALLFLASDQDFAVTPRPIAQRNRFLAASSGIMVGYGSNELNSGNGEGVRRASRAVSFTEFLRRNSNGKVIRSSGSDSGEVILSAAKYTVEDGDSGGGLYLTGERSSVAGIASRKVGTAEQEVADKGSVYVWLDQYRSFILGQCDAQGVSRPQFVS